jgi:hypothetical protein
LEADTVKLAPGEVMAVPIGAGVPLAPPSRLFGGCGSPSTRLTGPDGFDVAADGSKFLMICLGPESRSESITVAVNWAAALRR